MTDTWLEDRIVDLETQLEHERDRRIEAERPAAVLAEAERLLRDALVNRVGLGSTTGVHVVTYTGSRGYGYSLAEAFEKLTKGGGNG